MTGPSTSERAGELHWLRLLAYAGPALPLAILTLPFYVMVPDFYAREAGIPIAVVGTVLLVVRIVDAISDPAAGWLADRYRPAFGRRRLWMALSALPLAAAAAFVFMPPERPGALYLLLGATALSLAWTAAQVPYQAWGAELSRSYAGRTRVAAFRESFTVVGTLLALIVPAALPALGVEGSRAALTGFAVLFGIGLPLAALVAVSAVPEPPARRAAPALTFKAGWQALARNRPFARLLAAFLVNGLANGLPATLFLAFVGDRLGAPDAAGPFLVLYFLCGVAGVPFWLWLARRTSKHRAWCAGMILATATFGLALALGKGDLAGFAVVCVLTGLALGADVVLPPSIQADVIDVDTAETGAERAGLYFGLWSLATKLALALAVGIAFPVLGAAGFDPGAGIVTERGLTTLAVLYAGVPLALKAAAIALMWRFPLDGAALAAINARIDATRG